MLNKCIRKKNKSQTRNEGRNTKKLKGNFRGNALVSQRKHGGKIPGGVSEDKAENVHCQHCKPENHKYLRQVVKNCFSFFHNSSHSAAQAASKFAGTLGRAASQIPRLKIAIFNLSPPVFFSFPPHIDERQ